METYGAKKQTETLNAMPASELSYLYTEFEQRHAL